MSSHKCTTMYRPLSVRFSSSLINNLNGLLKDLRGCRKSQPQLLARPTIAVEQVRDLHHLRFEDRSYLEPRQLEPQYPESPRSESTYVPSIEELPVEVLPCQLCTQSTECDITLDSQKYFTTLCDGCAVRDLMENLEFAGIGNSPILQFL